jgi:hypothetical protein
MSLDREMLATDLAAVLSEAHGIDVDSDDVKRGLDDFLKKIQPSNPTEAAQRVAAFLRVHDETFIDAAPALRNTIVGVKGVSLLIEDVRTLVWAAGSNVHTRSLREKLAASGKLPRCPKCQASIGLGPTGIVMAHTVPGQPSEDCDRAGLYLRDLT